MLQLSARLSKLRTWTVISKFMASTRLSALPKHACCTEKTGLHTAGVGACTHFNLVLYASSNVPLLICCGIIIAGRVVDVTIVIILYRYMIASEGVRPACSCGSLHRGGCCRSQITANYGGRGSLAKSISGCQSRGCCSIASHVKIFRCGGLSAGAGFR